MTRLFADPVLPKGHRSFDRAARLFLAACLLLMCASVAAQPAGWTYDQQISVTENSGAALSNYQLRLTIDTASLITEGHLNADGSDLRFGDDPMGTTLYDYYLESGINTAATVIWVRLPSLPASATVAMYMYAGNPAALSASTLNVFDYANQHDNSATNQVFTGAPGGVTSSQRGFRFSPNQDVLVTQFGKAEPTGSTRYVTLFNFTTQAIIAQTQVSGPAGMYSYVDLAQPVWLTTGTQYLIELYQGGSDGYYFGNSSQINPLLTYYDMRYCNSCTQNSFPTSTLSNFHYGYPDFQFRTRQQVSPAPLVQFGPGNTTAVTSSDNPTHTYGESITFTATVNGLFNPTGTVTFYDTDGVTPLCPTPSTLSATDPPTAECTTSSLGAGTHQVTAAYSGDANNNASISPAFAQEVLHADTSSTLSSGCMLEFVGGQPFTVAAAVAGLNPTGTVTFLADGATPLCSSVALVAGNASCTTNALDVAIGDTATTHALSVTYSGDANYNPSSMTAGLQIMALSAADVVFRNGFEDVPASCPVE